MPLFSRGWRVTVRPAAAKTLSGLGTLLTLLVLAAGLLPGRFFIAIGLATLAAGADGVLATLAAADGVGTPAGGRLRWPPLPPLCGSAFLARGVVRGEESCTANFLIPTKSVAKINAGSFKHFFSVADPGSGAFLTLDPGWKIRIRDPG